MEPSEIRSGTREFLVGLFLGGVVLVISWFSTLFIVGPAGTNILNENYQFSSGVADHFWPVRHLLCARFIAILGRNRGFRFA